MGRWAARRRREARSAGEILAWAAKPRNRSPKASSAVSASGSGGRTIVVSLRQSLSHLLIHLIFSTKGIAVSDARVSGGILRDPGPPSTTNRSIIVGLAFKNFVKYYAIARSFRRTIRLRLRCPLDPLALIALNAPGYQFLRLAAQAKISSALRASPHRPCRPIALSPFRRRVADTPPA
jgi:hypothetical protein